MMQMIKMITRHIQWCRTYLLCELSLRNWLSTKLDVECVSAGETRSIKDADSPIAIVNDVDVDITATCTANVTRHVAIAGLRSVYIDDTFLADRYRCSYAICQQQVNEQLPVTSKLCFCLGLFTGCFVCLSAVAHGTRKCKDDFDLDNNLKSSTKYTLNLYTLLKP